MEELENSERVLLENVPLSTHCNSPLKFSAARAALKRPATGQYVSNYNRPQQEWETIVSFFNVKRIDCFDSSFHHFEVMNHVNPPLTAADMQEWHRQQTVSQELWRLNVEVLHTVKRTELPVSPPPFTSPQSQTLLKLYSRRCFFEEAVLATGSDHFDKGRYWTKVEGSTLWRSSLPGYEFFAGKSIFFINSRRGSSLLSRDHLVVFADLCAQRYILYQTTMKDEALGKISIPETLLTSLFLNGDMILRRGGNEAYRVIYSLEASCTARLVGDIPIGTETGSTYRAKVFSDGLEKSTACGVSDLFLTREKIIDALAENSHLLMQAYGLYRLWGHPTVEPLLGAAALRSIVTNVRMASSAEIESISNKFKEEFVLRFYAQKQAWPNIDITRLGPKNVLREACENLAPVPLSHPRYRRGWWSLVSFKPCFPVDPKFELLEVLSDKALSLQTHMLKKSLRSGLGSGTATDRSVIVQWLQSCMSDPLTFLKAIDEGGFTKAERSIGLREKEREGKIDARLFGLTTLFKRMYIVLTEALLAEHIIPLFPEITMVDDELSLDKKRLAFTKRSPTARHLFTSLDFSKWNSNMREEETKPLFKSFDELFGFSNVYQRTHEMFNSSFMYLLNGSYTPSLNAQGNFEEKIGSWYGHLGGIEGLRQKGWTIWTVTLILLCAENSPIHLKLMGQGDNQILKQTFPENMTMDECLKYHYAFLGRLNLMLEKVGPPLKMEETWTSEKLFIYGKYVIYDGCPLATSYKRLCRMFKMSNEDFPTVESAVSSMTANVSSALSCSTSIGSEFIIYISELVGLLQLFLTRPFLQKTSPLSQLSVPGEIKIPGSAPINSGPLLSKEDLSKESFFVKVLLLPRCLGGLPLLSLPQILIRGFPDDVGYCISVLKAMYQFSSPSIQKYIENILSPQMNPNISFELLLENPTSLNLNVPSAPGEARRHTIIKFLQESYPFRNPYFRDFLDLLGQDGDKTLVEFLSTCRPLNPVVLSALYDATAISRARRVAGKLQKTRTLSKLAVAEGIDLYDLIRFSEINHLRSVFHIIHVRQKGAVHWNPLMCSEDHARALRKSGWGEDIVGVDCALPLEIIELEENSPSTTCSPKYELDKGYISCQFPRYMTSESLKNSLIIGPYFPYRGSVTKQKVQTYGSTIASYSSPLLAKVTRLGSLIGWATPLNGNLRKTIEAILRSLTDIPLDHLLPLDDQFAGCVHHRFNEDRIEKGGAVGILPNYGTKIRLDTFPLVAYSKGSKNVNLMFQPIMSLATVMLSTYLEYTNHAVVNGYHIHIKSSCCIKPINEDLIDGQEMRIDLPCHKTNPFLFVPKEKAIPREVLKTSFKPGLSLSDDPEELSIRLTAILAYRIFNIIEVPNWSRGRYSPVKSGLMINWVLKASLRRVLEYLTLLLLAFYSTYAHNITPKEYMGLVLERVQRSDLEAWMGLSNLIHCPNFHHELAGPPYHTVLIGNPEMSESILASNVKKMIQAILATWIASPQDSHPIFSLVIRAPMDCGVITHPAMLHAIRDWIGGHTAVEPIHLRNAIVATINRAILDHQGGYISSVALELVKRGEGLIVPDNLDVICKRIPNSPRYDFPPHEYQPVPAAHSVLGVFSRLDTKYRRDELKTCRAPNVFSEYREHMLKTAALPTTGPYKGLSLMTCASSYNPRRILCCGDGSGGFALSALLVHPHSEVFFNTLITSRDPIQQTPCIPYLPALAGRPDLERRLKSLDITNDNVTDLTSPDYGIMFKTKMSDYVDFIACDAECPGYIEGAFPLFLAYRLSYLAHITDAKGIVFKTYALSPFVLAYQIACFLTYFGKVKILRCHFSTSTNSEVYLLAEHPVRPRDLQITMDFIEGYLVDPTVVQSMWEARESVPVDQLCREMSEYNLILNPDWRNSSIEKIVRELPFLLKDQPFRYPGDLVTWVQRTCMKRRQQPTIRKSVLTTEKFRKNIKVRIAIHWIIAYALVSPENQNEILSNWDEFALCWYPVDKKGHWCIALTKTAAGQELAGSHLWKISDLLDANYRKTFHRLIGMVEESDLIVTGEIGYPEGWKTCPEIRTPLGNETYQHFVQRRALCVPE